MRRAWLRPVVVLVYRTIGPPDFRARYRILSRAFKAEHSLALDSPPFKSMARHPALVFPSCVDCLPRRARRALGGVSHCPSVLDGSLHGIGEFSLSCRKLGGLWTNPEATPASDPGSGRPTIASRWLAHAVAHSRRFAGAAS
jgi:hypothetical protein